MIASHYMDSKNDNMCITINDIKYEWPTYSGNIKQMLEQQVDLNGKSITSIVLPKHVSSIHESKFANMDKLEILNIRKCVVESIPNYMCCKCGKLYTTYLPETALTIGTCAFKDCVKMYQMFIPKNIIHIHNSAFENCKSLSSLRFDENSQLTQINRHAFMNCENLEKVILPRNVEFIGAEAFENCKKLKFIGISSYTFNRIFKNKCFGPGLDISLTYFGLNNEWKWKDVDYAFDKDKEQHISEFKNSDIVLINTSVYNKNYDTFEF